MAKIIDLGDYFAD